MSALTILLASALAGLAASLLIQWLAGDDGRWRPCPRPAYLENRRREALEKPLSKLTVGPLSMVTSIVKSSVGSLTWPNLCRSYAFAGSPGGHADDELVPLGLLVGACFAPCVYVGLILLGTGAWSCLALLAIPFGPLVLWVGYSGTARERQVRIWRTMPYVYDLIVMALRSGISIPEALRRVTKDYEHEPIGEELGHVLHEVRLGTPRREALQHMAARIDVPELHQFVQSILQAEELGRPVAEALDRVAGQARTRRWQMIEKKANSAGVMIAVPSMLILIGNLLLLMGPFVLRILDSAREVM